MKLILAAGNIGTEYGGTRHNVGFAVLDAYATNINVSFVQKEKFKAAIAETRIQGEKVILAKPSTFYNNIGEAYHLLRSFYHIEPADTLIIHDELSLPFGTLRSRVGGSDAGNNGIKSINQHGGEASARLRVGIANDQRTIMGDTDFVLGNFSKSETVQLTALVVPKLMDCIDEFASNNHMHTSFTLIDNAKEDTV